MSLESWKTIFEIGGVILLFLTFVFGTGAVLVGKRINSLQAKQLQQFNIDLSKQQERAANAERDAAEAKSTASEASDRTLALESDAANAKERAAKAEKALLELQRRIEPRRVSPEQQARLISVLSSAPNGAVSISCVVGDAEGCALARQIADILSASGYPQPNLDQGMWDRNPTGLSIIVHSVATAPPYAAAIQQAFFSIGLPMGGREDPRTSDRTVKILVGNKPN